MKYFEITEPYYALITAETEEEAIKIYNEVIAEIDDATETDVKEVDEAYAWDIYKIAPDEDGKPIAEEEARKNFESGIGVLLVDSYFC